MKDVRSAEHPPAAPDRVDHPAPLHALGGLRLADAPRAQPKALLLLVFLALEGPQPRRRLATLFWPRAGDPLNRLSVTIARLRSVAPTALAVEPHQLATELGTDVAALTNALAAGRTDDAIARYRGPFLDAVRVAGIGEELEEWIATTRDDVASQLQRALMRDLRAATRVHTVERAVATAERVLELAGTALLDPDDLEQLHLVLRAGEHRRADAVGQDLIALGLTPVATGSEARERLERTGGARRVPTNLRSPATPIVGRERERLELTRLLARPDHRLITLIGPGGIGKSRLALQAATDQLDGPRFHDGIYFVRLESATSAAAVPERIAADLGVAAEGDDLRALTAALRTRHALLVLDNLEHLPEATPIVAELLQGCPAVQVLATSRDRLDLDGEWLYPVEGMPGPSDVPDVERALSWPAIELFEARAQRVQPSFRLTDETLPHVVAIHRMTGGSPLALELAAAHVGVMPVAHIATEIAADLDFLQATTRSAPDRHRSLRVVFEHSWQRLHAKDRACLQRLAVFRGGFTREAARIVAGATMRELTSLAAQALVIPVDGDRYERHPLVHQYTQEKLDAMPEERAQVAERHAAWALGVAKAAQPHFDTWSGGAWLDVLDLEHDNLRAALAWAAARSDATDLRELTDALMQFWIRRGHLAEALRWFDALLHHPGPRPDSSDLARSLRQHAFLHVLSGDTRSPGPLLARSLAIAHRLGAENDVADALSVQGIVAVYRGEYEEARAHYAAGLAIARRNGYQAAVARLLNNLGDASFYQGDVPAARSPYEESLALERSLGNHQMTSNVLGSLALVAIAEGKTEEARRHVRESVELLRELGITFSIPTALEQVGALATALDRPLDAARLWGAAESMRATIRVPIEPFMAPPHAARVAHARAGDPDGFDAAWSIGRQWSVERALEAALEATRPPCERTGIGSETA